MQTFSPHKTEVPSGDFPYFRRLWNTIVVALIGAAFIPLIVIGAVMYHYAASSLQDITLQALEMEVRHHQKTMDRFLAERVGELTRIAASADLPQPTSTADTEVILSTLAGGTAGFIGLGVMDDQGRPLAHAGPVGQIGQDSAKPEWFEAVMANHIHVGDVFYNSGLLPYFTIAVKHVDGSRVRIWHAAVQAGYYDNLLGDFTANGDGFSFLVNAKGLLQTRPPGPGQWMGPSDVPVPERFDGVRIVRHDGRMRAMGWLENAAWLSVVEVNDHSLFKQIGRIRNVGIFVFVMGGILIVFTALLTTNHLVGRLEAKRSSLQLMGHHLRRTNKMALSLLLHKGYLQEINEALANIDSTAVLIAEQAPKTIETHPLRDDLNENLGQIRAEILRSRNSIHKLIDLSRPTVPIITDININTVLDGLIDQFQREILFKNIRVQKHFQEPAPVIRGDPSQLEQVVQNLLFNALDAMGTGGEITLKTRMQGDFVHITVADNGPGIAPEVMQKLFEPPFTTRPGHLGLGLAICREILKKMGGDLDIASQPGKGAVFTVLYPVRFKP
jgi:two-component system, NtrC family, sensor kinase